MGNEIHWELCKKLKFHNTDKRNNHKSGFIQENKMHKLLWDIDTQVKRRGLVLINRKKITCPQVNLATSEQIF